MSGNKKFFIGLSNKYNEYMLYYINETKNTLIYIRRYDNGTDAINDLNKYSLIGTSDIVGSNILDQIQMYICNNIYIHDFIRAIFTIFKFNETPEFQELINIIDAIEKTNNDIVYKSRLDHLANCVYPDNSELKMYISMYYLAESIKFSLLGCNTLYDPESSMINLFINQIMTIFGYTPVEVSEDESIS